ncbi:MAG: response regulator [Bacillota bacterium]|nr:response regulator [Bacillota bacterium]
MNHKVLVIDDDNLLSNMIAQHLQSEGYQVAIAKDSAEAMTQIYNSTPDIILLDVVLPKISGFELCRLLRNDTRASHLPIIMLTSKGDVEDKVKGLESGADDYLTKPFQFPELTARIKSLLRRAKQEKTLNPLTGLPGNLLIDEKIKHFVYTAKTPFDVLYLDLDNFKAYNDVYGFLKGDEVLKLLAHIITQSVRKYGSNNDFIGHIGGDDFIVINTSHNVDLICQEIISSFDASILLLYTKEDRKRKGIISVDRTGQPQKYPIMSISIAVVSNRHRHIESHWEVSHIAAELKKLAKNRPGSNFVKDKRKE